MRPQPGHAMTIGVNERRPIVCRISCATMTSCVRSPPGAGVSDTRIVSPMPCCNRTDMPAVEATMPFEPIPASVRPEVQRVVAARGEVAIDGDEILHAAHFRGENDPVAREADVHGPLRAFERREGDGRAHHLLRRHRLRAGGVLVHQTRQQILVEAAPVHADAHRLVVAAGVSIISANCGITLAATADVARVDAVLREGLGTGGMLAQQLVTVEMEVADERHRDALLVEAVTDEGHASGRLARVDCHAHELGAGAGEGLHLLDGAFDVRGIRIRHRLHDDGRIAADADGADGDLKRGTAVRELGCGLSHRHKEGLTGDTPILQGAGLCCALPLGRSSGRAGMMRRPLNTVCSERVRSATGTPKAQVPPGNAQAHERQTAENRYFPCGLWRAVDVHSGPPTEGERRPR